MLFLQEKRDPDAEGVEGMSASKLRKAAIDGDFDTFATGVPKPLDKKMTKELYNTVRRNMGVQENSLWQIAPKLDFLNLRENFVSGNVFGVGDLIENLNHGLMGRIIRQGQIMSLLLLKKA